MQRSGAPGALPVSLMVRLRQVRRRGAGKLGRIEVRDAASSRLVPRRWQTAQCREATSGVAGRGIDVVRKFVVL
jgi:hypothetical protein